MAIYQNVQALDRYAHTAVRLAERPADFGFAANLNSVLLLGIEFFDAARSYPILFTRDPTGSVLPVALLGLRPNENLFVSDGAWAADHYVPAFLRRYPLILTDDGTVAIDSDFAAPADGEALFDMDGANTPALDRALAFLSQYQIEGDRTKGFIARLQELGLLKDWTMRFATPSGESFGFEECQVIDDAKLAELGDEALGSLFRSGELAWIYAHFVSLGALGTLSARLARRPAATAEMAEEAAAETT